LTVEHELATAGLGLSPPVPAASRPGDHAQRSLPVLQTQQARGLLPDDYPGALRDFQQRYVHPAAEVATWSQQGGPITLADVVTNANPTMLIGTSTQSGAFTEPIVRHMGSTRGSAHHHAAVQPDLECRGGSRRSDSMDPREGARGHRQPLPTRQPRRA